MKVLSLILMLILLAGIAPAAVHKVASDGTQSFSQIADAITASASGDTILVMAGAYAGFTVPHKLVIIGAGTGTGVGEGALVSGIVAVAGTADSTELRSLWIRQAAAHGSVDSLASLLRIHSGAQRVFVWRCFVENTYTSNLLACVWIGASASADFVQCTLWNSGSSSSSDRYGILYRSNDAISLTSCVVSNLSYGLQQYAATSGTTLQIKHCVFTAYGYFLYAIDGSATGVVENCAFMTTPGWNNFYPASCSYSYCAYTSNAPPGATNFVTTAAAFENLLLSDTRASDYHLATGSNLINAGNPGSPDDLDGSRADVGIYGGQHPFVDGGVPDYPFAVQVEVPYSAPLNGTMRIWARGRVGPGY